MSRRLHLARSMTVAFVASVLVPWAAAQQTERKQPPRRLPPTGSQTSNIPAGVDTGSPATSDSLPLGTPVPPTAAADRGDQSTRSAAARAAARPVPAAPVASGAASGPARPVAAASAVKPARSQKP
jgi:hypothetical protein